MRHQPSSRVQIRMHLPCTQDALLQWQVMKHGNQSGGHIFNFVNSRCNHADILAPVDRVGPLAAASRAITAAAKDARSAADKLAEQCSYDAHAAVLAPRAEEEAEAEAAEAEAVRKRYDEAVRDRAPPAERPANAFFTAPHAPAERYAAMELEEKIRDCAAHGWPVMWKQSSVNIDGHCEMRVIRVHTTEGTLCGKSQWQAYSQWSKEANLGAFSLDWMKQQLASRFVKMGLHWNVRSQWRENSDALLPWVTRLRDDGMLQLVDIQKRKVVRYLPHCAALRGTAWPLHLHVRDRQLRAWPRVLLP